MICLILALRNLLHNVLGTVYHSGKRKTECFRGHSIVSVIVAEATYIGCVHGASNTQVRLHQEFKSGLKLINLYILSTRRKK